MLIFACKFSNLTLEHHSIFLKGRNYSTDVSHVHTVVYKDESFSTQPSSLLHQLLKTQPLPSTCNNNVKLSRLSYRTYSKHTNPTETKTKYRNGMNYGDKSVNNGAIWHPFITMGPILYPQPKRERE